MTKTAFIVRYEQELVARYPWTKDAAKLTRFIQTVADTLAGGAGWQHEGDAVTAAWRAIGGKGKPTLKALRALPQ